MLGFSLKVKLMSYFTRSFIEPLHLGDSSTKHMHCAGQSDIFTATVAAFCLPHYDHIQRSPSWLTAISISLRPLLFLVVGNSSVHCLGVYSLQECVHNSPTLITQWAYHLAVYMCWFFVILSIQCILQEGHCNIFGLNNLGCLHHGMYILLLVTLKGRGKAGKTTRGRYEGLDPGTGQ